MLRHFVFSVLSLISAAVFAAAIPGQSAPDFAPFGHRRQSRRKLSDYKGKWVVLEWVNPGCPFVQKHYNSKNMQGLQKEYGGKQVVWLSINSTNPNNYDYLKPAAMEPSGCRRKAARRRAHPDGRKRRSRPRLRGAPPHAADGGHHPRRKNRLRRGDRRQALHQLGRCQDGEELRQRRAHRGDGRQAGDGGQFDTLRLFGQKY